MTESPLHQSSAPIGRAPWEVPGPSLEPPLLHPDVDPDLPSGDLTGATPPPTEGAGSPGASGQVEPSRRPKRRRRRVWRWLRRMLQLAFVAQVVVAALLVSLCWWTPDTTAFMLENSGGTVHQNVSIDHMSRYLLAATIAHEDSQLGTRAGAFDASALLDRARAYLDGQSDPSGSTIPQQLAKNLFLWPSQTAIRKAMEAVLSTEMMVVLPAQRVLELYLNVAQFGPRLYGVCAATWYYFGTAPWDITQYQAAELMGVLPAPNLVSRASNGGIDVGPGVDPAGVDLVNGAANVHVPRELKAMGGWQAAVATVGITDTASDHAAHRGDDDACSRMPSAVAELISAGS